MKRIFVVENKKAKVEFNMAEMSVKQINDVYNALVKANLGWETREFKYDCENEVDINDC